MYASVYQERRKVVPKEGKSTRGTVEGGIVRRPSHNSRDRRSLNERTYGAAAGSWAQRRLCVAGTGLLRFCPHPLLRGHISGWPNDISFQPSRFDLFPSLCPFSSGRSSICFWNFGLLFCAAGPPVCISSTPKLIVWWKPRAR